MTRARETSENERQAKAWVVFDGSASGGIAAVTEDNVSIRMFRNISNRQWLQEIILLILKQQWA